MVKKPKSGAKRGKGNNRKKELNKMFKKKYAWIQKPGQEFIKKYGTAPKPQGKFTIYKNKKIYDNVKNYYRKRYQYLSKVEPREWEGYKWN